MCSVDTKKRFKAIFTRAVFQTNKGQFLCPLPKIITVKGLVEPKVTVFAIYGFSGLQETFLSNFYPCRLPG